MKIGYARVSTLDQNLDMQTDALTSSGCERLFEEKKSGKAGTSRPELIAALSYLRPDDTLVVWKLDRLGRSLTEMMRTIDELRTKGIHFQSLTEQFDSNTAHGRFALQMHGATAEYFLDLNRERTLEGMKAAVARGRKGGRPKLLSAEDLDVVRMLMAGNTLSIAQIAKRVGVARQSIYRYFPGGRVKPEAAVAAAVAAPANTNLVFKRRTGAHDGATEKNGGVAFHAVPEAGGEAVCGAKPRRGGAWSAWSAAAPTCPKCVDMLKAS